MMSSGPDPVDEADGGEAAERVAVFHRVAVLGDAQRPAIGGRVVEERGQVADADD
jgi:hypothetical protein